MKPEKFGGLVVAILVVGGFVLAAFFCVAAISLTTIEDGDDNAELVGIYAFTAAFAFFTALWLFPLTSPLFER